MDSIKFLRYGDPEFALVKSIRIQVFVTEQGIDAKQEFDEHDRNSLFALLYDGGSAVATARVCEIPQGRLKIGRIAVLPDYRKKHCGSRIVNAVLQKSFATGVDRVYVDAQVHAVPFYEKLGFRITGTQIVDRGLYHIPMCVDKGDFNGEREE